MSSQTGAVQRGGGGGGAAGAGDEGGITVSWSGRLPSLFFQEDMAHM